MNLEELKYLLDRYHLTPNKVKGQNFLVSDEVLEKIIHASVLDKDNDLVLEVGPGLGALSQELVTNSRQVIAFEIDKNFDKLLTKLSNVNNNFELIWQNILSLTDEQWDNIMSEHNATEYKIVANIPYYLTNKFIQKFLNFAKPPKSMTIMIQKEVADRIVAKDKKNSLLSLAVDFYASSKVVDYVGKENFYPMPKVDSAILYIYDIKKWSYDVDEKKTWQIIKRGFAKKRKKLFNNLLTDQDIKKDNLSKVFANLQIDQNIRAEKLTKDQWLEIVRELKF